jgi:hypothetical protein
MHVMSGEQPLRRRHPADHPRRKALLWTLVGAGRHVCVFMPHIVREIRTGVNHLAEQRQVVRLTANAWPDRTYKLQ